MVLIGCRRSKIDRGVIVVAVVVLFATYVRN
jgi:hypothetical protein